MVNQPVPIERQPEAPGPGVPALRLDLAAGPVKGQTSRSSADIVLVIDTTGSMTDKIQGLLDTCRRFVEELANKLIDWQIAVVAFGDLTVRGDKITATEFAKDANGVKRSLAYIPRYSGGGNDGESCLEALEKALGLPGSRSTSVKVFILITDEPALQEEVSAETMTQRLRAREAVTFVISPPLGYFQEMASRTGGHWFQVAPDTDFLSILNVFEKLGETVATTIQHVQLQAGGSVEKYLQLPEGKPHT